MKDSTMFRKAARLLSGKGKWTKHEAGYHGPERDNGLYCALGAIGKISKTPAYETLPDQLSCDGRGHMPLSKAIHLFNDGRSTTQADVVTLLLLESELAKSEGR